MTSRIGSSVGREDAPAPDHPDKPVRLRELSRPEASYALRRAYNDFFTDECMDLAAALTYYGVLAIFPGLLAMVSLLGLVGASSSLDQTLVEIFGGVVPGSTLLTLRDLVIQLEQATGSGWTLVIGVLGAAWSSSAYIGATGRALNRVYDIDEGRRWWILRPQQLLMALLVLILMAAALLGLILGGPPARSVMYHLGFGHQATVILEVIRWPALFVIAVLLVAALYYGTPNVRQPHLRWVSPGALVAIVSWFLMSLGFMVYVGNFGTYNQTYGALGGVIVFLLWLWLANVALLAGAEIDAALERVRQLRAGIEAEDELQLPARHSGASEDAARVEAELIAEGRDLRLGRVSSGESDDADRSAHGD